MDLGGSKSAQSHSETLFKQPLRLVQPFISVGEYLNWMNPPLNSDLKFHNTVLRCLETGDLRSHQVPNPSDRNYGKVNQK
ncbi:MAG: hypothetical protein HWQ35_27785 [Nostoc sp. NMS1]|uniref:hypothetical protein n=1 Tax=unclassified Nostoc TaxID=2593658 RepID=UPI0025D62914|nr:MULTISPECIES: hypothetical protein [unclassified Nostoc]MBN3910207.1 hypothetical protein [Nostoc sp. NMS1]MBN3991004.1 hypothetical protein [Nostoc sp. NMS2]